ncbi:MAG: hypothetical protein ACK5NY_05565 [Burkholderiaceae bacterium]
MLLVLSVKVATRAVILLFAKQHLSDWSLPDSLQPEVTVTLAYRLRRRVSNWRVTNAKPTIAAQAMNSIQLKRKSRKYIDSRMIFGDETSSKKYSAKIILK